MSNMIPEAPALSSYKVPTSEEPTKPNFTYFDLHLVNLHIKEWLQIAQKANIEVESIKQAWIG